MISFDVRRRAPSASATRAWTFAALVLAAVTTAPAAHAQGTGRSMDIDPSVRSSGMGGASGAVFWGGDANFWGNPALLGYHEGLRYLWSRTRLVPGLANNVVLTTNRGTAGWGGIGLAGGVIRLSYGDSQGTDDSGNPTGTFESYENIDVQAVGVSASRLIAALSGGNAPRTLDYGDVAVGWARKDVDIVLAPAAALGEASGVTHDWGVLARISPMPQALADETGGVFLDLSYAHSVLNYDDTMFDFGNESSPATHSHRNGFAARTGFLRLPGQAPGSWLVRGFEPLAVVGFALDQEHNAGGDLDPGFDVTRWGVEATLCNIATVRVGHVTDRTGDIDGGTFGFGFGLPFGDFAGVRYDYASIPQATSAQLPDVKRHAVTAWIDPIRLAAALRKPPVLAATSAP